MNPGVAGLGPPEGQSQPSHPVPDMLLLLWGPFLPRNLEVDSRCQLTRYCTCGETESQKQEGLAQKHTTNQQQVHNRNPDPFPH